MLRRANETDGRHAEPRFSWKEYIGPFLAAPMAGVTIRASLLFRALALANDKQDFSHMGCP